MNKENLTPEVQQAMNETAIARPRSVMLISVPDDPQSMFAIQWNVFKGDNALNADDPNAAADQTFVTLFGEAIAAKLVSALINGLNDANAHAVQFLPDGVRDVVQAMIAQVDSFNRIHGN